MEFLDSAYYFVLIPLWFFILVYAYYLLKKLKPKNRWERVMAAAALLGGFFVIHSWSAISPIKLVDPIFDLSTFLKDDIMCFIGLLHAVFLVGFYSSFVDSGNPRYAIIFLCMVGYMGVSACVSFTLSVMQARALDRILPQVFSSATMSFLSLLVFCMAISSLVASRRVHYLDFKTSRLKLESSLPPAVFQKVRACANALKACLALEVFATFASLVCNGWLRAQNLTQMSASFEMFQPGFMESNRMGLHFGFILGTALDACLNLSEGSLHVSAFARLVFGLQSILHTTSLGVALVMKTDSYNNTDNVQITATAPPMLSRPLAVALTGFESLAFVVTGLTLLQLRRLIHTAGVHYLTPDLLNALETTRVASLKADGGSAGGLLALLTMPPFSSLSPKHPGPGKLSRVVQIAVFSVAGLLALYILQVIVCLQPFVLTQHNTHPPRLSRLLWWH
jgi:hypothetical protein